MKYEYISQCFFMIIQHVSVQDWPVILVSADLCGLVAPVSRIGCGDAGVWDVTCCNLSLRSQRDAGREDGHNVAP